MLIGYVVLNEVIMFFIIGGGFFILIGVFMVNCEVLGVYLKKSVLFKK